MRIRTLDLIRYGKFSDRRLELPLRARDLHLIVGPNEAGKSTLRAAISDWLFGIPKHTPFAFLHPMPELRLGGVLERPGSGCAPGLAFAFVRTKGNKHTLRTPADAPLPDDALLPWLGSLQAQGFKRMYALDHQTLVEGGAGILSASDDLGRMLFQSAAGIEHLGAALTQLQEQADALWAPRKSGTRAYYQALASYEAAQAALKSALLRPKDWKAQHDALLATAAELDAAKAQDAALRQQLSRLERIRRVRPLLQEYDAALARQQELLSAGEVALLEPEAAALHARATQDLALAEADIARLQSAAAADEAQLHTLCVDRELLALHADITELNERRVQFRAHRTDMLKCADEIRLEWTRVLELARGLAWPEEGEPALRQRLPAATLRARLSALLTQRIGLEQDLHHARTQLAERQAQTQLVQAELQQLAPAQAQPELALALEQALQLGDYAAQSAALQGQIDALALKLEAGLAELGPWRRPLEALQALVAPEQTLLQNLIEQQRAEAAEEKTLHTALSSKTQQCAQLELELEQLVRTYQPVAQAQVLQARSARDAAWQQIKLEPVHLHERAQAFEGLMAGADQLADARLERAQYEAQRQSKHAALERAQLERQSLAQALHALKQRLQERSAQWHALASASGLPDLPLELAPSWLAQRQQVLHLQAERAAARQRLASLQAALAQVRRQLWLQLDGTDSGAPAPELGVCVRAARAQIAQADHALGQRQTLQQQLRAGQQHVAQLQAALQAAQHAWQAWLQAWQAALQHAGYAIDATPAQVEAELDALQSMERLLERIRTIRSERLDTMQADLDGLAQSARALAARIAPDLIDQPPEDLALELARRLDVAGKAAAAYAELADRLQRQRAELAQAQQNRHAVLARLAPLLAAAGVAEVSALGRAIQSSDARRTVEHTLQSAQQKLVQAGDGLPLHELRQQALSIGADALMAELEQVRSAAERVVERIATLSNAYGIQKTAFQALDGADTAAQAEAQRQEALAAMADAAQRYLQLQTAARLLKWSLEQYRQQKQGPMLSKASAMFRALTLDSFQRLLVDTEDSKARLLGIRVTGEQVPVEGMSEGTRDQLYLALRLAALALQVEQGHPMPLIADDLFINFDDQRTAAGLQVLGELSRHMQILFLTHHDHLLPLAREVLGHELNVLHF